MGHEDELVCQSLISELLVLGSLIEVSSSWYEGNASENKVMMCSSPPKKASVASTPLVLYYLNGTQHALAWR